MDALPAKTFETSGKITGTIPSSRSLQNRPWRCLGAITGQNSDIEVVPARYSE
jgi:hypothetical protein